MATSNSNTKNNTYSGSSSSTTGGSTSSTSSHTEGGSHSTTQGYSDTTSSSTGGAQSISAGKSYASGQISDKTQAGYDKATGDYVQSDAVANAYNALQSAASNKPTFQSTYADKLSSLYDKIMNRDKFSYNFNEDSMYQLYKDKYTQMGKTAMQDTMGQASKLSGGYGSSYSQTAAQQSYQDYLQDLNNIIPELRQQAYDEYQAEGQQLLNQYSITNDAYNNEYGQYRDSVSDWQTDRAYNQSAYQDERNFDYNQYTGDRSFWQNEYWQEKNSEQSNIQQTDQSNWSNSQSHTNSFSTTDTTSWSDTNSTTNTSNWSNTNNLGWQTSDSTTNSTSTGSGFGSGGSTAKYTADWSHNANTPSSISSANIVQQLYETYKSDGEQGLSEALGYLRQNGLKVGDTKYTFGKDDITELTTELSSVLDNVNRYSNGKEGLSYQITNNWINSTRSK